MWQAGDGRKAARDQRADPSSRPGNRTGSAARRATQTEDQVTKTSHGPVFLNPRTPVWQPDDPVNSPPRNTVRIAVNQDPRRREFGARTADEPRQHPRPERSRRGVDQRAEQIRRHPSIRSSAAEATQLVSTVLRSAANAQEKKNRRTAASVAASTVGK